MIEKLALHDLPKQRYLEYLRLMPNLQPQKLRVYTTLLLTLGALILFGVFAINPTISTILELRKQLNDSTFVNAQLDTKMTALSHLQEQYFQLTPRIPIVDAALPKDPQAARLLGQLQAVAQTSNVTVAAAQVDQVDLNKPHRSEGQASSFTFSLTAEGTNAQLVSFMDNLVHFNRLITLDSVSFLTSQSDTKALELTIRGRSYFHP